MPLSWRASFCSPTGEDDFCATRSTTHAPAERMTPPPMMNVMKTFGRCVASRSQAKRSGEGGRVSRSASATTGSTGLLMRYSRRVRRRSTSPVASPTSAITTIKPKNSARFHSHRLSDTIM
jgi:hypothetical protein